MEHNDRVRGVPNSNHLHGFAVDIHGTSKAWLKKHGLKYGWKNLDYDGHDGHFDYIGGDGIAELYRQRGAGNEGNESTADPDSDDGGGGIMGMLGSIGDAFGFVGELGKAFIDGFMEGGSGREGADAYLQLFMGGMKSALGGVMDGITNMFGGNNNQSESSTSVSGTASGDMIEGTKLIMEAGVPKRGAAYLAGNIQQESSWNGQRDWGEVMNDGTSRNGGLVSWASWSDDPARLGRIERHLGKNISQASDGEQISAMLWEMKKHYPNAHATFMSPNASASELRAASKAYWGYGEEGSRYAYAQQILEQMQQNGGIVGRQRGGSVGRISSQQLERLRAAQAGHKKQSP